MVLLNLFFTWLASLCICFLTARGFLGSGQPGLLMFGCGSLLWGVTSLAAAVMVDRVNPTITVHNVGVLGAALCHLVGLLWHGRLPRPGRWLVVGYAGALMAAALIFWAAMAGLTPVFFVQGQGGTLVRQVVLLSGRGPVRLGRVADDFQVPAASGGVLLLVWVGPGVGRHRADGGLLADGPGRHAGLDESADAVSRQRLPVHRGVDGGAGDGRHGSFRWRQWRKPGGENELLAALRQQTLLGWALRYGLAVVAVAAAMGLRLALTAWVGPGLPTYITFYPAVMVVALLAGFGPGLVATALAGLVAAYWILPPVGQFAIASPVDRLGLVIFTGMGLFMSVVAELYRRNRDKAAAYDREAALRESQARLATFAEATFEGIVESEAGRIVDCNEQFARMLGYSVAELRGMEIASLIAPEDRDRVMANIRQGRESAIEHAMLRKDGTRIVVEAHGRPVSPGSARRHTAIRDITERKRAEEALRGERRTAEAGASGCENRRVRVEHPNGRERLDAGVGSDVWPRSRRVWQDAARLGATGPPRRPRGCRGLWSIRPSKRASRSKENGGSSGAMAACIGSPGVSKPSRTPPASRCASAA